MNKYNELAEELNRLLNESDDKEPAIRYLRASNYSKLESIEILRKVLHIPYYEAQHIVHHSQTWSDVKEFDTKLINDFFDVLEETKNLRTKET
jgi:hypothetical protein